MCHHLILVILDYRCDTLNIIYSQECRFITTVIEINVLDVPGQLDV